MAKSKPTLTLAEMERELGYKADSLNQTTEAVKRFYSDLRPVPDCAYEKMKRELEEYERKKDRKNREGLPVQLISELGDPR